MTRQQQLIDRIGQYLVPIESELSTIPKLKEMFHNCFMNSLETTMVEGDPGKVYFITGDIPAMWLRDSSEQVHHYVRFAAQDPMVAELIEGVLAMQAQLIQIDPYANSYNQGPNGHHLHHDVPKPGPWVWEQKYEIDSLAHVMWLAANYHRATGRDAFLTPDFIKAMETIVTVIEREQNHETQSEYSFTRYGDYAYESLPRDGKGAETAYTGMTWSGFRPSDDPCKYGYFVPGNLFAVSALNAIEEFAKLRQQDALAKKAANLREEITVGIEKYALINKDEGSIYAFEVDGLGNQYFMDDANIPGLLSLPYLGICSKDDPLYQRTRKACLSKENPFYYEGKFARGIGSPHTPEGYIWHIALCVQGMTSCSVEEKADMLSMLLTTTAGTGMMHESFQPDNPEQFTRPWFAWANSMFAEFVYQLYESHELQKVLELIK